MSRLERIEREDPAFPADQATAILIQGMARGIEKVLPHGTTFALVTFAEHKKRADYISNGRRDRTIKALRETADRLEKSAARS